MIFNQNIFSIAMTLEKKCFLNSLEGAFSDTDNKYSSDIPGSQPLSLVSKLKKQFRIAQN